MNDNISINTFLLFETNNCIESRMTFDFVDSLNSFSKFSGFFYNIRLITKSELVNFLMFWGFDSTMINDKQFLENLIFCFKYFKSEGLIVYFMLNMSVSEIYYVFSNKMLSKLQIYQVVSKLNKSIDLECWRFYVIFYYNNIKKYVKFVSFKIFKQLILSSVFFFDDLKIFYNYKMLINMRNDLEVYLNEQKFFEDLFYKRINFLEVIDLLFDNFVYNLLNTVNLINYMKYTEQYNYYKFKYLSLNKKLLCFKYDRYNCKFVELNYFLSILHEIFCFFRLYIYRFYFLIKNKGYKIYVNKFYKIFKYRFLLLLNMVKIKMAEFEFYCILLYIKIRKYFLFMLKNNNFFFILMNNLNIIFYKIYKIIKMQVLYKKYFFYNLSDLVFILLNNLNYLRKVEVMHSSNLFFDDYKKLSNFDFIKKLCVSYKFSYRFKQFLIYYYLSENDLINLKFISLNIDSFKKYLTYRTIYWFFEGLCLINCNFFKEIEVKKNFFVFNYIGRFFFLSINYSLFKVLYNIFYLTVKNLYLPIKMRVKVHIENFFFFVSEEFLLEDFNLLLEDLSFEEMHDMDYVDVNMIEDESDFIDDFYEEFDLDEYFFFYYMDELVSVNYYIYELLDYKYVEFSVLKRSKFGINDYFDFLYSCYSPLKDKEFIYLNDYEFGGFLEEEFDINTWYNWLYYFLIGDLIQFLPNIYEVYPSSNLSLKYKMLKKKKKFSKFEKYYDCYVNLNLKFKVNFEYIYNNETKQYDLIFKYEIIYVDDWCYYMFINEKFLDKLEINNYSGNIVMDEDIITEYSCFNDFFKQWFYYNRSIGENSDVFFDKNVFFDFFIGFNRDSGVRDLVILHEMWIWWEYILRMYSVDVVNKFLYPTSVEELLFLNSYIISGLYSVIMSNNDFMKGYFFKIFNNVNDLNKLVALIYYNLNVNNVDFEKKGFLVNENINEQKFIKNIEVYYYKYLSVFNNLIFLNNYLDLYIYVYEYMNYVYKSDNLNSVLYMYIRRIEDIYMFLLHNSFMSFMGSYYLNVKKSNLLYFWETFFLSIIETVYSLVDFDKFFFFEKDEGGVEYQYLPFYQIIPNMSRIQEAFVFEDYDFINNINLCYLNKLYLLYLNPYLYLSKGLNINYSIVESLFFDMYELYMINFIDIGQDYVDLSLLTQLKFFEGVDYEIRLIDNPLILAEYFNDYKLVDMVFDKYEEIGFREYVEYQAYESVDFSNYYLMESYNKYLERYYSINKYNLFFYGLFVKYLSKNIVNNFFFEVFYNLVKEVKSDLLIQKDLVLYINKNQYIVELIYYYIFCMFFKKLKIKSFSFYYIKIFFYFFLFFFKRIKVPYYYYYYFIKSYSAYFFYLLIKYIKVYYNINYNFERIMYYFDKIFYKIIINSSVDELYRLLKFLYKKIYRFIKLLLLSLKSFKYKYLFIFKYNKLLVKLLNNNYYLYMYNLFNKKNFLYKNEFIIGNIYNINNTMRSFLSTIPIYIFNKKEYVLNIDFLLFFYFFKYKKEVNENISSKQIKHINFSDYFYMMMNDYKLVKSDDLVIDHFLLERFDSLKDVEYYDYEDNEDDASFYADEWTSEWSFGDLSDDFYDEIDEDFLINNEETLELEELNKEIDIDLSLMHINVGDVLNVHTNVSKFNLYYKWSYRYLYYINNIYYKSISYFRQFIISLFNLYKKKIPLSTGILTYKQGNYIHYNESEFNKKYKYFNKISPIKLIELYKDQRFMNQMFLYKKDNFDYLIPKYIYTNNIFDIFDYFIDYNQIYFNESIGVDDVFYVFFNIMGNINNNNKNLIIKNCEFIKLLKFFSYFYLVRYICQYFDMQSIKNCYFSLFFFDLNCLFKKFILKFCLKYKMKFICNIGNYIKYIYDKLYLFLYNQLEKFINNKELFYKNNDIIIDNFIRLFYNKVPFYFFNIKFLIKKLFLLKTYLKSRYTLFSYFILLKALDWFFVSNYFYTKKDFYFFFFKILDVIGKYERLVFFNNYKLIQVYSKYGVNEMYFFFEQLYLNKNIDLYMNVINELYQISSYILYLYELVVYLFVCFIIFLFIVKHTKLWIFKPFYMRWHKRTFKEVMHHKGTEVIVNNNWQDKIFYYFINGHMFDIWGIF